MELQIQYGLTSTTLELDAARTIVGQRKVEPKAISDLPAAIDASLKSPVEFPPLVQALTPDDHVAIVIDDELNHLEVLVSAIIRHLGLAAIRSGQITVVCRANLDRPDLELAWPGTKVEIHDPTDRERIGYLATTKGGRRIYINRTVVEADQVIVVAQARFGQSPARWLYPLLSDQPKQADPDREIHNAEIKEVCWLMGLPFFVQVIPGPGDSVARVLAGPANSFGHVKEQLRELWRLRYDRPADTAVACVTGPAELMTVTEAARAAHNAARVTADGGKIILLFEGKPELDASFSLIRDASTINSAIKKTQADQSVDHSTVRHWLNVIKKHRVFVLSSWPDDLVEELFATPLQSINQVQKLVGESESVAYVPDAHRSRAEVNEL